MYHFMVGYVGDRNPTLDQWADDVAEQHQGKRLGDSYCLFAGERSIQYGYLHRSDAERVRRIIVNAEYPGAESNYYITVTEVTNKGWVFPPPVVPIRAPHLDVEHVRRNL
jgi:hypothetical protein